MLLRANPAQRQAEEGGDVGPLGTQRREAAWGLSGRRGGVGARSRGGRSGGCRRRRCGGAGVAGGGAADRVEVRSKTGGDEMWAGCCVVGDDLAGRAFG